jgi:hypothetical protein
MGDDIEIQFRGGNPKKWHSGKMRIEDGLVTVTAQDGRTKSAQLGGSSVAARQRPWRAFYCLIWSAKNQNKFADLGEREGPREAAARHGDFNANLMIRRPAIALIFWWG